MLFDAVNEQDVNSETHARWSSIHRRRSNRYLFSQRSSRSLIADFNFIDKLAIHFRTSINENNSLKQPRVQYLTDQVNQWFVRQLNVLYRSVYFHVVYVCLFICLFVFSSSSSSSLFRLLVCQGHSASSICRR
jgi:hypothetical protein